MSRRRARPAYGEQLTVDATAEARKFLRMRGRRLYVWRSAAGFTRCSTDPPKGRIEFLRYRADGFELWQDTRIPRPLLWRIVMQGLWRRRRPRAYWNSRIPGGVIGSGYGFWRELFRRSE